MEIRSFKHKGLKALAQSKEPRNTKGLHKDHVKKLHNQLTLIRAVRNIHELVELGAHWKVHCIDPPRPKTWSMSVTGNYRLTFILEDNETVSHLDLEDYH